MPVDSSRPEMEWVPHPNQVVQQDAEDKLHYKSCDELPGTSERRAKADIYGRGRHGVAYDFERSTGFSRATAKAFRNWRRSSRAKTAEFLAPGFSGVAMLVLMLRRDVSSSS